jgi:glucose/mannose-6-phosphate isomerase
MATPFLDNRAEVTKLDPQGALTSFEMLGSQVQQIWEQAQALTIDSSYSQVKQVVVAGMGGSALGTHVIQTVFKDELKVPVLVVPDYELPSFVDSNTLVITSSYSGSTEETLAAAEDAKKKGAKIIGITSGGKLGEWLTANQYPALIFEPKFNPANSPRMAMGYSVFGQIALFAKAGLLTVDDHAYQAVMNTIAEAHLTLSMAIPQESNPAKLLAFELLGQIPVITVAEHLEGVGHVFANCLNENSKTFSEYRVIPELNHHLMEGLQFPDSNKLNLVFVTIHSDLYLPSNTRRVELTEEVLDQNHVEFRTYKLNNATKLEQAFELIVFGAYTSFYLAMLNNQNPTPNPYVDWFKAELKKEK